MRLLQASITKYSILNLMGLGFPILVAILTMPYLIAMLGTERFGILALMWTIFNYASLCDLGLSRALTQQLSTKFAKNESYDVASLVWAALVFLLLTSSILAILIYSLSNLIVCKLLTIPLPLQLDVLHTFNVMLIGFPFVIATHSVRGILESNRAFGIVNVIRIPMGLVTFIGPLLALKISDSLMLIAVFIVIGKILNFLLYFYFCFQVMPSLKNKIYLNKSSIVPLLKMGGWTTISNVIYPLMENLDRFFIAGISLTAVTYYVTPQEMITKLWLIPGAFTAAFFPEFVRSVCVDIKQLKLLYQLSIKYIVMIIFPLTLVVVFFAQEILSLWLGKSFSDKSYFVLQWLALGVLVSSLAQVPYFLIQAMGLMHLTAKIHVIELAIYFAALWFGIKQSSIEVIAVLWFFRMVLDAALMFFLVYYLLSFVIKRRAVQFAVAASIFLIIGFCVQNLLIKTSIFIIGTTTLSVLFWDWFNDQTNSGPDIKKILAL